MGDIEGGRLRWRPLKRRTRGLKGAAGGASNHRAQAARVLKLLPQGNCDGARM